MSQLQIRINSDDKEKKALSQNDAESISRRSALQKMGYAAFASSTLFLLLNNPTKVYATSQPGGGQDPGDGFDFGTKSGEAEAPKEPDPWKDDSDPWKQ